MCKSTNYRLRAPCVHCERHMHGESDHRPVCCGQNEPGGNAIRHRYSSTLISIVTNYFNIRQLFIILVSPLWVIQPSYNVFLCRNATSTYARHRMSFEEFFLKPLAYSVLLSLMGFIRTLLWGLSTGYMHLFSSSYAL